MQACIHLVSNPVNTLIILNENLDRIMGENYNSWAGFYTGAEHYEKMFVVN